MLGSKRKVNLGFAHLNVQVLVTRRTNALKTPEVHHIFNTNVLVLLREAWIDDFSDTTVNGFEPSIK